MCSPEPCELVSIRSILKMKLILPLTLLLVPCVIPTALRVEHCKGIPIVQDCTDEVNSGHKTFSKCYRNINLHMWWYNATAKNCQTMSYNGCGGNTNRYCSNSSCHMSCDIKPKKRIRYINKIYISSASD